MDKTHHKGGRVSILELAWIDGIDISNSDNGKEGRTIRQIASKGRACMEHGQHKSGIDIKMAGAS